MVVPGSEASFDNYKVQDIFNKKLPFTGTPVITVTSQSIL